MRNGQGDLRIDNPLLVRWEFACEERLATRTEQVRALSRHTVFVAEKA